MTNVAAVHGISQQQSGRNQLIEAWLLALRDGIERAVGRNGPAIALDMGFYADLYAEHVAEAKGLVPGERKGLGPLTLDADEVAFLTTVEAEVVDEEPPPTKGFIEMPAALARFAAWIDHKFGAGSWILAFGDLVQVRRYQRDDVLAEKIRARVGEAIAPDTRVLIGHSLGSVVAYETLCLQSHPRVNTLVTLGSPLGLSSIQHALRTREPPPDARWVNVYDTSDPVACGGALQPAWPAVTDFTVDNEDNPHAAVRYLGKRPTGQAVVSALAP